MKLIKKVTPNKNKVRATKADTKPTPVKAVGLECAPLGRS